MTEELLTDEELAVIGMAGELWNRLCAVVADGPTRDGDLAELVIHIHAIQRAVGAQAAARAYPDRFRRLGALTDSPEKRKLLERIAEGLDMPPGMKVEYPWELPT